MNAAAWTLALLVAIAGAAVAAPVEMDLSFHAPGQAAGDLAVDGGEWALLLFAPGSAAELALQAGSGGAASNFTDARYSIDEDAGNADNAQEVCCRTSKPAALPAPFAARLAFGGGKWSALYVEAGRLDVEAQDADATLVRAHQGGAVRGPLPDGLMPPTGTVRAKIASVPSESIALGLLPPVGQQLAFKVTAHDVRFVHWYNGTVACSTEGYCPDAPDYRAIPLAGRGNDVLEFRTYHELRLPGGDLAGEGSLMMMSVGGPRLDLGATGAVRLPDARTSCTDCIQLDHQTFTSSGTLRLEGLQPDGGSSDRVQTSLRGELQTAAADESLLPGFSGRGAVAGVAIATGIAVAVKVALAFFTRHRRPALENPRAKQIYDLIQVRPGLSFTDLRLGAGTGTGNLARHLRKLAGEGLIVARDYRNSVRYYENHGRYDVGWERRAALQDEDNQRLYDWLLARPGSTQTQVHAGAAPHWSRSTLRHTLGLLEEAGLLRKERQGRFAYYFAVPAAS